MPKTLVGQRSGLFFNAVRGQMPTVVDVTMYPGNVFYVDSGDAGASDAASHGIHPDSPFATLDYAVGQCTANQGDVIFVLPGHVETIGSAGALDLDVAGIEIRGIGHGTVTPKLDFTAAAADVDIDAANVKISNFVCEASFADVAVAFDVNATDFHADSIRFTEPTTNENFLVCFQDAAAAGSDRMTITNCVAEGLLDAANTHFVNFAGTGTGHWVEGNRLHGDWGTMAIGGAGVVTFATIINNYIANEASDSDACINFAATATGMVVGNHCAGAAVQANGVTATAMLISQNYYGVISEDLSAILDPIAT